MHDSNANQCSIERQWSQLGRGDFRLCIRGYVYSQITYHRGSKPSRTISLAGSSEGGLYWVGSIFLVFVSGWSAVKSLMISC